MYYKGIFITIDTLSIIVPNDNNTFHLAIFKEKQVVFSKDYKTRTAAEIQNTRLINRYDLLFANK